MHKVNAIERSYGINELKKDWFFKLLVKFLKMHGLYELAKSTPNCLNTMHSHNYCITKMFVCTINCSIHSLPLQDGFKYDKLWLKFIIEHEDYIPESIKRECCKKDETFDEWLKGASKRIHTQI